MSTPKKISLHPAVRAFLNNDLDSGRFVDEFCNTDDPLLKAMVLLRKALYDTSLADEALQAASSVEILNNDPTALCLFFDLQSCIFRYKHLYPQAMALLEMARNILPKKSPPLLSAMLFMHEGLIAQLRGNLLTAEDKFRQAGMVVPLYSNSKVGDEVASAIMMCYYNHGKGVEAIKISEKLRKKSVGEIRHKLSYHRFRNFLETGEIDAAIPLLPSIKERLKTVKVITPTFNEYCTMLDLLRNTWTPEIQSPPINGRDAWPMVFYCLWRNQSVGALQWAQKFTGATRDDLFPFPTLRSWALLYAELAAGNGEAARRLILSRKKRGGGHYLDDFHLGRIELLSGNREAASRHFSKAIELCKYYNALKRLDFEIRIACELSPTEMMSLASQSGNSKTAKKEDDPVPDNVTQHIVLKHIIGPSHASVSLRETVLRFACLDVPVLITGETGTGKELAARAIHESGSRKNEPFITLNCGALSESLLESELFGYVKGAFTGAECSHCGLFESAGMGTIQLDEIGDISPRLQVTLLRVLESGEIRPLGGATARENRCRILATTNASLENLIELGKFRKDLFYRLRRLTIHIPPLRQRKEDIIPLAEYFFSADRKDGKRPSLSRELKNAFIAHDWPGNIRELKNTVERMRLMNSEKVDYGIQDFQDMSHKNSPPIGVMEENSFQKERSSYIIDEGTADLKTVVNLKSYHQVEEYLQSGKSRLRRIARIKELFAIHKTITAAEITELLGVSRHTITRDLKFLRSDDFIRKIEPTASPRTHYFRLKKVCAE